MTTKTDLLNERLLNFSLLVVNLVNNLPKNSVNEIFGKQVIRSSSSIGANYSESIYAHSRIDFIHCINISRKEANETVYWLKLLKRSNSNNIKVDVVLEEANSILKIFISSVKTARLKTTNTV